MDCCLINTGFNIKSRSKKGNLVEYETESKEPFFSNKNQG